MKYCIAVLSVIAATSSISPSALAHHGPGQFNGGEITVTGKVSDIRFVNPHAYIYLDAIADNGESEVWRCQMSSGSALRRAGWTEELFPVGDEITISGDAGTRERTACSFQTAILADGREIDRNSQFRDIVDNALEADSKVIDGKLDLNGTWASPQLAFRIADGSGMAARGMAPGGMAAGGMAAGAMGPRGMGAPLPAGIALTDAGTAAVARYQEAGGGFPRHRCEVSNIFQDWTFNDLVNEIIQTEDTITMKFGFMDIVRTIHLNMDEHPDDIEPSIAGHSIGKLDGATLTVDTIGFVNDGYLSASLIHSDQFHVTETFTYNEEDNSLTRVWSGVDPLNFTGTYSGEDVVYISNTPFEDYACVELMDDYIEPIEE